MWKGSSVNPVTCHGSNLYGVWSPDNALTPFWKDPRRVWGRPFWLGSQTLAVAGLPIKLVSSLVVASWRSVWRNPPTGICAGWEGILPLPRAP